MKSYMFFSVLSILFVSLHSLFYLRVIRRLLVSSQVKKALTSLLVLNFLLNLSYFFIRYSDLLPYELLYLSSTSIGVTFVLLLYLILHEVLNIFHFSLKKVQRSKREFIKKTGDGALLALATSYVTAGVYEGSKEPVINVVKANLFDFSIVQISDLHIGGLIDKEYVKESVIKINTLNPDLVMITGDLVDTEIESIAEIIVELNNIESKYGIYMVLGNHEYFHNPYKIIDFIKTRTKVKLLLNESVTIEALKVNIVGVNDLFGYRTGILAPNFAKAFSQVDKNYPSILLSHQPKSLELLGSHKPKLILSGHTHGGQIWPFNHLVMLQQPYLKGLHTLDYGGKIYVNSGIGFWGPPMRLGSQAEIAYII
ncbi:metallophosphoesterase [Sulfurimonas microaerophilic]|uniref:metallophosphoesterase n=1 Tax=Sulfurimonas microaerophilic TaxID=3058392 RepID=UPI002714C353|nr:metallophosphoesterase [Sulfurimonas sp. hsl 1-7]